jgi:hypothetical protein
MTIARLLAIGILGILLFEGYKYARPRLEPFLSSRSSGGSETSDDDASEDLRCVDLARRANSALADTMRQFSQPPVNQQEWTSAFISVNGDIGAAENACMCASDACDAATTAVDEMRDLALSFDGIARGGTQGMSNPARIQERIDSLLDEAALYAGR